jgi:hypothetical protein
MCGIDFSGSFASFLSLTVTSHTIGQTGTVTRVSVLFVVQQLYLGLCSGLLSSAI